MQRNGFVTILLYVILVFLAVALAVLVFFNARLNTRVNEEMRLAEEAASATPTPSPSPTPTPNITPEPVRELESTYLRFAGEVVGHAALETQADYGEYHDFTPLFEGVVDDWQYADFAACTLVSNLSVDGVYESYLLPHGMVYSLGQCGVDLINAATDHAADYGLEGILNSLDRYALCEMDVVGIYGDEAEREATGGVVSEQIGNLNVAFLSYTYGTGGVSVADYSYALNIYTSDYMSDQKTIDEQQLAEDIQLAEDLGSDLIVCFVYWWDDTQYYTEPTDEQRELAEYLCSQGVDVIVGAGCKVPQPIEVITTGEEDAEHSCLVLYSLGTLASMYSDKYTNLSGAVELRVDRDVNTGEVFIANVSYDALYTVRPSDFSELDDDAFLCKVFNIHSYMETYENGGALEYRSGELYSAMQTGLQQLRMFLGEEYDVWNGGQELMLTVR